MKVASKRQSGIELLRILLIMNVFLAHGVGLEMSMGLTGVISVIVNCTVPCFMLCSGYFGIRRSWEKGVRLEGLVLFAAWFSLGTLVYFGSDGLTKLHSVGDLMAAVGGPKTLLSFLLPTISGQQFWFITRYFALFLLAPYINAALDKMDRRTFEEFLIVGLVIFSVIPTFFFFDFMGKGGKELVYFTLMYCVGRYRRRFGEFPVFAPQRFSERFREKKSLRRVYWSGIYIFSLMAQLVCNFSFLFINGTVSNYFSRDLSFFVFLQAIALFELFVEMDFYSSFINRFAASALMGYLLDMTLKRIVVAVIRDCGIAPFTQFWAFMQGGDVRKFILILMVGVIVFILAVLLNELRLLIFGRLEKVVSDKLETLSGKVMKLLYAKDTDCI